MKRREFIAAIGGAVVWPVVGRAQQPALPVVGVLAAPAAATYTRYSDAFRQGLNDTGYVEGQNFAIEYRWAEGHYDRLPAMAAELVDRQVAVIATIGGTPAALAAKAATTKISIVFLVADDPMNLGLVDSIARPTGNATGISILTGELEAKRLELVREIMPNVAAVGVLFNPSNPQTGTLVTALKKAADVLRVKLTVFDASTASGIDSAFAAAAQQQVNAMIIGADSFFLTRRDQLVSLSARYALPTIYRYREEAAAGGLLSYGTELADAYRREGTYVGRVLKGDKPADLPVQQAVKIELVLNLKTAKALGLEVPPQLLARADEVIE